MPYDTENPYGGGSLAGAYGRATSSVVKDLMKRRRRATQEGVNKAAGVGGTSDQIVNLLKESNQAGLEETSNALAGMNLEHAQAVHQSEEAAKEREYQERLQKELLAEQQQFQNQYRQDEWNREDSLREQAKKEAKRKNAWKLALGILGGGIGTLIAPGIGTSIGFGLGSGAGDMFGGG